MRVMNTSDSKLKAAARAGAVLGAVLTFALAGGTAPAYAAEFRTPPAGSTLQNRSVVVADIDYLYHWTSVESLKRLEKDSQGNGFPFLKKVATNAVLGKYFPDLRGKPAFFVWKNALGGIGTSKQEIYPPAEDPALIRFKMRKGLRVLLLQSDQVVDRTPVDLKGVDVIFHDNRFVFKELVIVNPDAIEAFTADPQVLREDMNRTMALFRSFDYSDPNKADELYLSNDLFNHFGELSENFDNIVVPLAKKFLEDKAPIPAMFRQTRANCSLGAAKRNLQK